MSANTIKLGTLVTSARLIAGVLRVGGRYEAAKTMENLIAAVKQLTVALAEEQARTASLMRALQDEIVNGGSR